VQLVALCEQQCRQHFTACSSSNIFILLLIVSAKQAISCDENAKFTATDTHQVAYPENLSPKSIKERLAA
jgi:hypothetical protein